VSNYELTPWNFTQVRTHYANWQMIRDVKRRKLVKEYYQQRLLVNALRRNSILPHEIRVLADYDIQQFPRDSCRTRLNNRCVITSRRPQSTVMPHRLSRIWWRHLADYNKLSGVARAMW
jgi:small subunit ribosomal protein S14